MISHKTNQIVLAAKPLAGDLGRRFCLAALFAATFAHQSTGANGQQPVDISQAAKTSPASYVQGELLVKVQSGPYSQKASLSHAIAGATVLRTFPAIGWQHIRLPEGMSVREGIEAYRTLPGGVEAEPNYTLELAVVPNDPRYASQWGLRKISAPTAWDTTTGSSNVVVAVIDTGVDYNHEDLRTNLWHNPGEAGLDANGHDKATNGIDDDGDGYVDDVYGIDAGDHDSDPMDPVYHGTACAGIIGAVGNNAVGVAGVNWLVRIMALRYQGPDLRGSVAGVVESFEYVVQQRRRGVNVRITSNSYVAPTYSQAVKDAIDVAGSEGILTVCAAGNDGVSTDADSRAPADFDSPYIISVAASDESDLLAGFSNFGRATVDMAAPGVDIATTWTNSGYATSFTGTSAACPYVSGAAALLWSVKPDATPLEVKAALMQSVDQTSAFRGKVGSNGRLNLASALQAITNVSLPPVVVGAFPASSRSRQDAAIEIWFNEAMDRASVEGALQITPAVTASSEWSDGDRVLRLRPSSQWGRPFP